MAKFEIAFERRIPIEGGHSLDLTDNGNWLHPDWRKGKTATQADIDGWIAKDAHNRMIPGLGKLLGTNWGVTCFEYAKFLKREPTFDDMKNMPKADAIAIFKPQYWDVFSGDEIADQGIANDLYDASVNGGLSKGIAQQQEAADLAITGKMDDHTIKGLNNEL